MGDEDYKVTSEIYTETDYCTSEKTTINTNCNILFFKWKEKLKNCVIHFSDVATKFKFEYPPHLPRTDKDGDLIVQRKTSKDLMQQTNYGVIEIGKWTYNQWYKITSWH